MVKKREGYRSIHKFDKGETVVSIVEHRGRMYVATQKGVYVINEKGMLEPLKVVIEHPVPDKKSDLLLRNKVDMAHMNALHILIDFVKWGRRYHDGAVSSRACQVMAEWDQARKAKPEPEPVPPEEKYAYDIMKAFVNEATSSCDKLIKERAVQIRNWMRKIH